MATKCSAFGIVLSVLASCPMCTGSVYLARTRRADPVANLTAWLESVTPEPKPVEIPKATTLESILIATHKDPEPNRTLNTTEIEDQNVESAEKSAASVFHELKDSARELKQQIEDAENAHIKEIKDHEEYLQHILQEKRGNNSLLEEQNALYRKEIAAMRDENDRLFQRAKQLKLESKVWRDNWRELEQNLTLAMEVTQVSLDKQEDLLRAPIMEVITELNAQAEKERSEKYRNDLMVKVSGEPIFPDLKDLSLAMVKGPELTEETKSPSVVRALDIELQQMAEATQAELRKLDETYEKIFAEEAERETAVLKDQANLQRIKGEQLELQGKLRAAVAKLEALKDENEHKGILIRKFASDMSTNQVPTHGTKESWNDLTTEEQEQRSRLEKRMGYTGSQTEDAEDAPAQQNATMEETVSVDTLDNSSEEDVASFEEAPLELNTTANETITMDQSANETQDAVDIMMQAVLAMPGNFPTDMMDNSSAKATTVTANLVEH